MGSGRRLSARTVVSAALATVLLAGCGAGGAPIATSTPSATRPAVDRPTTITTPTPSLTATPAPSPTGTPAPEPAFDKRRLSIDDPASLWVVVNKLRPLRPADYEPGDLVDVPVAQANPSLLRREAADATVALFAAAADQGLQLASQSAYRSFSTQVRVYNGWVDQLGQEAADRTSARPGHSEHQTGLGIDISAVPADCSLDQCFGDTPHGKWLAANAWRFGFVLRYPQGSTPVTGYEYEPWHFRYVGKELAAEIHEQGSPTLEEFFGLPPAPTYAD